MQQDVIQIQSRPSILRDCRFALWMKFVFQFVFLIDGFCELIVGRQTSGLLFSPWMYCRRGYGFVLLRIIDYPACSLEGVEMDASLVDEDLMMGFRSFGDELSCEKKIKCAPTMYDYMYV